MILLIDNYDSFSYNLVQMIGSISPDIRVVRNDKVTVEDIKEMSPSHLVLSPGPGYPKDAGILEQAVRELKGRMPILGVCLGHQGICEAFGGTIVHAGKLMHGKQGSIEVNRQSHCLRDWRRGYRPTDTSPWRLRKENCPGNLKSLQRIGRMGK